MNTDKQIQNLATLLGVVIPENNVDGFPFLVNAVEHLIRFDFNKLLTILYRRDIDENKLKERLAAQSEVPASFIIAQLLIEREEQKAKYFDSFHVNEEIAEEDKW